MCGLSGFAGIKDIYTRRVLAETLGWGIDTRGGHAMGFVSLQEDHRIIGNRAIGRWDMAKESLLDRCASGPILMQHARFATHGSNVTSNAHPFLIKRKGKADVYGMHNGIAWDADESAKRYRRPFTVDSKEVFECLADGQPIGPGYGVLTWVERGTGAIYLAKASDSGDIEVAKLKGGGLVYGSTRYIVQDACDYANQEVEHFYKIDTGIVYQIDEAGIWITSRPRVEFESRAARSWLRNDDDDMADLIAMTRGGLPSKGKSELPSGYSFAEQMNAYEWDKAAHDEDTDPYYVRSGS